MEEKENQLLYCKLYCIVNSIKTQSKNEALVYFQVA